MAPFAPKSSVRRLLAAMNSADEDTSMAAYMALVKLGPDSAQTVVAHMQSEAATPEGLRLLGDLGDASVIPYLEEFANSDDADLASAARESLQNLRPD
jgi:HEAT repeat protein